MIEEYKKYVDEHIKNVQTVWSMAQKHLVAASFELDNYKGDKLEPNDYHDINELIETHDNSKYSEPEFEGYAQLFYPDDPKTKNEEVFNGAWQHHYRNNPHHWEHWVVIKHIGMVAMCMPFVCVIEMLCDWTAMSLRFGNIPSDYYASHKDKMVLHEDTQMIIDTWLPTFDKIIETVQDTEK